MFYVVSVFIFPFILLLLLVVVVVCVWVRGCVGACMRVFGFGCLFVCLYVCLFVLRQGISGCPETHSYTRLASHCGLTLPPQ